MWKILLLFLVTQVTGQAELAFLYPNGNISVTTSAKFSRVTLFYKTDFSFADFTAADSDMRVIAETFVAAAPVKDIPDFQSIQKGIEEGKRYLEESIKLAKHWFAILPADNLSLGTDCVFERQLFAKDEMLRDVKNLRMLVNAIGSGIDWTKEKILADPGKLNLLISVVEDFSMLALKWKQGFEIALAETDSLKGSRVPPSILGLLESSPCLDSTVFEKITVLNKLLGKNGMAFQLSFNYPSETTEYVKLVKLSYDGVVLKDPDAKSFYVREKSNANIQILTCEQEFVVSDISPICRVQKRVELCTTALTRVDIESIISNCNFNFNSAQHRIFPMIDGGVLIQDKDIKISSGNKPVINQPPQIIYSDKELVLTDDGIELIFDNKAKIVKEAKILTSVLSTAQRNAIYTKAVLDVVSKDYDWPDYLLWAVTGLQLIVLPLLFCNLACICGYRRKLNSFEKARRRMTKQERKDNYEANQMLLRRRSKQIPYSSRSSPPDRPPFSKSASF